MLFLSLFFCFLGPHWWWNIVAYCYFVFFLDAMEWTASVVFVLTPIWCRSSERKSKSKQTSNNNVNHQTSSEHIFRESWPWVMWLIFQYVYSIIPIQWPNVYYVCSSLIHALNEICVEWLLKYIKCIDQNSLERFRKWSFHLMIHSYGTLSHTNVRQAMGLSMKSRFILNKLQSTFFTNRFPWEKAE